MKTGFLIFAFVFSFRAWVMTIMTVRGRTRKSRAGVADKFDLYGVTNQHS